jgi:hypothetical protein
MRMSFGAFEGASRTTRWVVAVLVLSGIGATLPEARAAAASAQPLVRLERLAPAGVPKASTAIGPLAGDQQLDMSVVLPPSHSGQLASLLQELYDPKSPEYHHWLRPGSFLKNFSPSESTVSAVETWLHKSGFSATAVGFAIRFTASASHVSQVLGVGFERYRSASGTTGYLNSKAPLIPTNLGPDITAILGLDTVSDFAPESGPASARSIAGPGRVSPNADGLTACQAAQSAAAPGYYTLDELGAAYGIGSLLAVGENGHGMTIGLYELASHSASDISTYQACFGLSNPLSTVSVDGGGGAVGGGGTQEADTDIEQVMTQSPSASVISYEGPNSGTGPYDTWNSIVTSDKAQVVSTSWGACEPESESAGWIPSFSTLFEQAATQGQTVVAASGDSGSEDCYRYGNNTTEQVDYPASDPMVTAVGGTTLSGPGDETVWNFCQTDETITCANNNGGQAAGGGGMSRYESRPSYQPNILTWPAAQPCGLTCREVPDVSANAGIGMVVYSSGWIAGGGTSYSAPFMAGLVADKNNGCTTTTGLWTRTLYSLASEGVYGSALNDITSGNNDMTGSNGGAFGAGSGYDAASGLGSPIAQGLSCAEITSVQPVSATPGSDVTVYGLGLEKATIDFGYLQAQVLSSSATQATVVVPQGGGSVNVEASSPIGQGVISAPFTYSGSSSRSGYDLVGADGGVFVLPLGQSGGYYGSLPGLGIRVNNIKGMVPSSDDKGYYLVGSDGGVFAFGDARFANSLPGLGVRVDDIVGIVPTTDNKGYFLVGADGGVFAFGDAPFLGSLPGDGIHINDVIGIAATPSDEGYWVVAANGTVYAFGDAPRLGSATDTSSPVAGITSTPSGGGYWIVTRNGGVYPFGDAKSYGSLPGLHISPSKPIVSLVPTESATGYWLIGSDGGIFAFDAPYVGSLPGLRVSVDDIVGAVPTDG